MVLAGFLAAARADEVRPWDVGILSGLVSPFSVRGWGTEVTTNGSPYDQGQVVSSPSIVAGWIQTAGLVPRYGLAVSLEAAALPEVTAFSQWTNIPMSEVTGLASSLPNNNLTLRAASGEVLDRFRLCAQAIGIACGEFHTLMLRRDGTVTASGWNIVGQAEVPEAATNVVAIACGLDHSLALRADGTALGWGRFIWRNQPTSDSLVPPPGENRDFVAVAGGVAHAMFLRRDGRVLMTGREVASRYAVPGSLTNAVSIASGAYHCIALTSDHRTVEWGYELDDEGLSPQLDLDEWPRVLPQPDVVAVAAGGFFSMALRRDGTVAVWGEEDEDFEVLKVPDSATNVVAIAAGTYHAMALRADGTVVSWGAPGVSDVPPDLQRVVAIAAGGYHNQVLIQNQEVLAWPRVEGGRFRAELNLPAGMRFRLESAGPDGRWIPGAPGVARPGNLTVDVPITGTESRIFRAVPLIR
jgi:alpha-tubulin suppressor-like RCC1 family protein